MTKKLSSLTPSCAAAEYLIGLCKIVRGFNLSAKSAYVDNPANADEFWIQNLCMRVDEADTRWPELYRLRVDCAMMSIADGGDFCLRNAKLGLADDLITAQGMIERYSQQETYSQFLNNAIAKEMEQSFAASRNRKDYAFWHEEVLSIGKQCDMQRSELMNAFQQAEDAIKRKRITILNQAYGDRASKALLDLAEHGAFGRTVSSCVQLRQFVVPCRRQTRRTFQYQLMHAETNARQRIYPLLEHLAELDAQYQMALYRRESEV